MSLCLRLPKMIKHLFVVLILEACGFTEGNDSFTGEVIHVAPGSDVSLKCVSSGTSGTSSPFWDRISTNGKELLFENTAYLLVENFQPGDKGTYRCSTKSNSVTLEEKSASQSGTTLLFRRSGEQKAHLFCKILSGSAYRGQWSWKHHENQKHSQPIQEQTRTFGTRLVRDSKSDNDFSLSISPVWWQDAGLFQCLIEKGWPPQKTTVFKLILIKVEVQPQVLFEGDSVELVCYTTAKDLNVRLCWIELGHDHESEPSDNHYHAKTTGSSCINKENHTFHQTDIRAEKRLACVVFYNEELRALVDLRLNVTKRSNTNSQSTQPREHFTTTASSNYSKTPTAGLAMREKTQPIAERTHRLITLLCVSCIISALVLVPCGMIFCKRRCKDVKSEEQTLSRNESVVYTEVHFKTRKDSGVTPVQSDTVVGEDELTKLEEEEETAVIYAGLILHQKEK
ncbi:uncharacterized protein LOC114792921 isoform X2 [Denticeps clupeoides]|uniref:uncharacterized protein LOC114792921 isoform X2 n=1 Tax=Denticeps clupeoides TaxID=299321 RepID=UPI0010A3568F|nr:uncharacterized protein LOC114792921 isoform X2 [Denticeps clupeoides]